MKLYRLFVCLSFSIFPILRLNFARNSRNFSAASIPRHRMHKNKPRAKNLAAAKFHESCWQANASFHDVNNNKKHRLLLIGGLFADDQRLGNVLSLQNYSGNYSMTNRVPDNNVNFSNTEIIRKIVNMALDDIAKNRCILPGYSLNIDDGDTQVFFPRLYSTIETIVIQ